MNTKEILSIIAIVALGLCLLCGLAKMAMKSQKAKQSCDHACSLLVFVAVILLGVSQLLGDKDPFTPAPCNGRNNKNPNWALELAKSEGEELNCINGTGDGKGTDTCASIGKKPRQYCALNGVGTNVCGPQSGTTGGTFNKQLCALTCCE